MEWSQNQRDCFNERRWNVANTTDLRYRKGVRIVRLVRRCAVFAKQAQVVVVWGTEVGVGFVIACG